ncbi:MAG: anion permease, partial [Proteobacteria bacterium]|nr:anion permease [Pseudomonadota bacterium]
MFFKTRQFQLGLALALGIIVILLPRPEGTKFKITGDEGRLLLQNVSQQFALVPAEKEQAEKYIVEAIHPKSPESTAQFLQDKAAQLKMEGVQVDYVNGLSPKAKRFLAVLVVLIFLFVAEPIPLEITAICIGVFLVIMGISDVKGAWAPYMHPVVVFIMCCLIFAISLDKAGITKRLGYFIVKKAGTSVTKFTFIIAISLGISSSFMHDAAACAIGIITMLPLMRAAGIEPHTRTAKFMMLSLPFGCSCGGMGSLIGGGRCMVSAAFLKEFTGLEITFFDWIKYAMPAAIICVPIAVGIVYLVFRPDPKFKLPVFDEEIGPWTPLEKKTLVIIGLTFALWLTKGFHGIHYSVTGMLGVGTLVLFGILKWEDINDNL